MPPREDDLPAIRAALAERWETLATNLLGDPVQRGARVWRWGHKGSLSAVISGARRGSWHGHEAGQGGGPLGLIMHAHRLSIADAIAWARTWTGARAREVAADKSELRRQAEAAAERGSAIGNAR